MGIVGKNFKAAIAAIGLLTTGSLQAQAAEPAKNLLTPR